MVRKIFTSRISNGCNSFDTMCLCVCVRVFQKRNFFSYQSAKLTNCPPVPRKHSPQITTTSDLVLICKDSLVGSEEQLVNLAHRSSKKLRFRNALGCHGNQWSKPTFATLLYLSTKFGDHRSINSEEEPCGYFLMFYW